MASEQTTETKPSEGEPRITYVGNHVNLDPKEKKKRDAVDKKVTPIRSQKKKIVNKHPAPETAESECECSAINVAYIAGIFGIITEVHQAASIYIKLL